MKILKKGLCLILACALCLPLFACGGKTGNDNSTKITVMNFDGGVGGIWLTNAMKRFEEKVKDVSYEEGKKGVYFDLTETQATGVQTMNTAGYNVYFDANSPTVLSLSQSKFLVNLDDIVKEKIDTRNGNAVSIEDKINQDFRQNLVGADGKYYALPYFALYAGLTYNVDLFREYDMFIAAPDAGAENIDEYTAEIIDNEVVVGTIGTVQFAKTNENANVKLSCGNDGKYGTEDDGLPTSMVEFFVLCDRLKYNGIEPISFAGKQFNYTAYLFDALWASLSGGLEASNTRYTFDGTGTFVTRNEVDENNYESEGVWAGFDSIVDIKKPKTETIKITKNETGYRANDNVARYYAIATFKILEEMGWFSQKSYSSTDSHTDGMETFIFSGENGKPKQGMFIEGDYWYNEATENNKVSLYKKLHPNKGERQIAWMPLPTHPYESVTSEANARPFVMTNTATNYAFINANIQNNAGLLKACKEFLQFVYTDSELSQFTGLTGVAMAGMKYDVLEEHQGSLSYYHKKLIKIRNDENTILQNATKNELYDDGIKYPTINGKKYGSYVQVIRQNPNLSVEEIFRQTCSKSSNWGTVNL